MAFDPAAYLEGRPQKKSLFKTPDVEAEYETVNPALKAAIERSVANPFVTSGSRSLAQNVAVGGVPTSRHLTGGAVDLRDDVSPEEIKALRGEGVKVLRHGGHVHTEATDAMKPAEFDPEAYLKSFDSSGVTSEPQKKPQFKSIYKDNPLLGFGAGLTKQTPGTNIAGSLTRALGVDPVMDLIEGMKTGEYKKTPLMESLKSGYGQTKSGVGKAIAENPEAALAGQIVASIPQYASGMGALGAGAKGVGIGGKALRSMLVSPAVGQAGRGFEFDPMATAIETIAGPAGEFIQGGVQKVAEFAKPYAKKAGTRILESIFKTPKIDIKAGKGIGGEIYERGIGPKTRGGFERLAKKGIETQEDILQSTLKEVTEPVAPKVMADEIAGLKKTYEGISGTKTQLAEIDQEVADVLLRHPESIPASEANVLKRKIYSLLGDVAYKRQNIPAVTTGIQKAQAKGLRKGIEAAAEKTLPGLGEKVAATNKELAFFGRMKDRLADIEAGKQGKDLMKLMPFLTSAALGAGGGYGEGTKTGIAGAALPLLLGTPYGKSLGVAAMRQAVKSAAKGGASKYFTPFITKSIEAGRK